MDILPKDQEPEENVFSFSSTISWGISDEALFMELMAKAQTLVSPGFYLGDNLFTWGRNNSLFSDRQFVEAFQSNIMNDSDVTIAWRRYILATSAYHCVQLEGDFVECGVYWGTGIKTVVDYLGRLQFTKTFWGYDTYDYHPEEDHNFDAQQQGFFEQVKARFTEYNQVRLIKGLLPDILTEYCPDKIAYLHIDLNSAKYEVAVLEHLFDLVVSGGMIILDDYEWAAYRPQKIAEDKFFNARLYRVIPLPTGQGLLIKR